MTRLHFMAGLLALGMAVGCKAQPAPPSPELALNSRIQVMVRAQFSVPQDVVVTLGARKPSQIPGYDTLPVTLSSKTSNQAFDFLISTDNKTLARLEHYSLTDYPLFNVAGRPIRGNPEAIVTVINYDDLECPYCAQMHQAFFPATLERYKDKVRFIYKDNPLVEIHPWAMHAAVDANCLAALSSDVYWNYVDYIHSHSQEVTGEDRNPAKSSAALDRIARQQAILGKLDSLRLDVCLARQDESPVRASMKEAETMGVEGAPTLFVNGQRFGGAVPQEMFWTAIDHALQAAGVEPPAPVAKPQPSQPSGKGN